MVDQPDRSILIRLSLEQLEQAEFLQGLESWLRLGLLSDQQVRQVCQQYLVCALPASAPPSSFDSDWPIDSAPPIAPPEPIAAGTRLEAEDDSDFADAGSPTPLPATSTRLSRSLQAFMAEISVVWLLFLGVFLVVVSSGVLAVSQWQNVSPVGQYGILLTYTLVFFGVGRWAGQRSNLHLTARMLQIATLLIIPVNFWMMDGLQLWRSVVGIGVGTIAVLVLSLLTLWLWRPDSDLYSNRLPSPQPRLTAISLTAINSLGLSWLHLGWDWSGIPLIATYVGTIGTAFLLTWAETSHSQTPSADQADSPPQSSPAISSPAMLIVALSTLLLIGRAVFAAQVPFRQLGLALGICGWVFCWLSRTADLTGTARPVNRLIWTRIGSLLLLAGWLVSVMTSPPWQAIAVSGLALWLLIDRLEATGRSNLLVMLVVVGLQAYGLLWRLFPFSVRQAVIETARQVVGDMAMPDVLLGVAGFPYLWLILALAGWLRQKSSRQAADRLNEEDAVTRSLPNFRSLSKQADTIAFVLGLVLSIISLLNPGVRSLHLLLSTATLFWLVARRTTVSPALIYLTHLAALTAILSSIDWQLPMLSQVQWVRILLGVMAIEWGLSVGSRYPVWRQSAWFFGLGLAGVSYVALLPTETEQALIWLVAPTLLTGLSQLGSFAHSRLAAWLSTIALCGQLLLLNSLNAGIITFAVATGLMCLNTATLRQLVPSVLTVGFALGLEATLIWKGFADQITQDTILLLLAAALWQLWLLRHWLGRLPRDLAQTYASALNGWAIGLCGLLLLLLTGLSAVTLATRSASSQQLLGAALGIGAIGYRVWQQPTNLGYLGLAWGIETATAIGIGLRGGDIIALGIANVGLGLVSQSAGNVWVSRSRQFDWSWHAIPLLYAGLGLWLVHSDYTALTGLYSLIAACVGLGVARRSARFNLLTLLSLLLVSFAAYELLIYQLSQLEGENAGDGWALLSGLAMLFAWSYHGLGRWLQSYLRLGDRQRRFIAHAHWFLGSSLAGVAVFFRLSVVGTGLLLIIALALSGYALTMGNDRWRQAAEAADNPDSTDRDSTTVLLHSICETWTYAGLIELLATIAYGLYEAIPGTAALLAWAGTIASIMGIGLYSLPWTKWGWSVRPGRRLAIGLPILVVGVTVGTVALQSLLIVAAFYAWLAKALRQIRVSYLSVLLFDWALLRFLGEQDGLNLLWIGAAIGGSLLYGAQIDPALQPQSARNQRHWLRSLATGLISLTAFYQAEVETGATAIGIGLLTLGGSFALIMAGLLLRTRAFLYIGTATFILRILRWLWLFINTDSFLLWSVGILLGIALIWIAATFEARRSQVNALVQYWSSELETWE